MKTLPPGFLEIAPHDVRDNVFHLIGDQWMLLTVGTPASWSAMTSRWGGFGVLWQKPVAFVFVRPTRETFTFMEKTDHFTLSVLPEQHREAFKQAGAHTIPDLDKAAMTGLRSLPLGQELVTFEESRLVFVCRKLYYHEIDPMRFVDQSINEHYNADYHRMYVGEVQRVLQTQKHG